jgi:hypothetical protein
MAQQAVMQARFLGFVTGHIRLVLFSCLLACYQRFQMMLASCCFHNSVDPGGCSVQSSTSYQLNQQLAPAYKVTAVCVLQGLSDRTCQMHQRKSIWQPDSVNIAVDAGALVSFSWGLYFRGTAQLG